MAVFFSFMPLRAILKFPLLLANLVAIATKTAFRCFPVVYNDFMQLSGPHITKDTAFTEITVYRERARRIKVIWKRYISVKFTGNGRKDGEIFLQKEKERIFWDAETCSKRKETRSC